MSNIAEVHVPAGEFALRETLEAVPDAEFEVERVAAHGNDRVLPFVWATADDLDEVERALDADPSVKDSKPSSNRTTRGCSAWNR